MQAGGHLACLHTGASTESSSRHSHTVLLGQLPLQQLRQGITNIGTAAGMLPE
jgi:hypothetical protein